MGGNINLSMSTIKAVSDGESLERQEGSKKGRFDEAGTKEDRRRRTLLAATHGMGNELRGITKRRAKSRQREGEEPQPRNNREVGKNVLEYLEKRRESRGSQGTAAVREKKRKLFYEDLL